MSGLSGLIARLESATNPDRELDVAIGFAVGRVRERDGNYLYATGNDSDMVVEPNAYDDHLVAQPIGYYTASVDAAMSLMPEDGDSFWHVRMDRHSDGWYVAIWDVKKQKKFFGEQKPQALAICIAALQARNQIASPVPLPSPSGEARDGGKQ